MLISFKKQFVWSFGLFVLVFFLANIAFNFSSEFVSEEMVPQVATVLESVAPVEKKANIELAFVGDIMLDRGVKSSVYESFAGDYGQLFIKVRDQLRNYDILFANLEGPISDLGVDIGGLYSFRMEPKTISVLKDVGFDILSVTNNHIFNWGEIAFLDTLQSLSRAKIDYVGGGSNGPETYGGKMLNVDGVKIIFLAFSEFEAGRVSSSSVNPGIAVISKEEIRRSVSLAKKNSDLVVVSFHFGEEYADAPNTFQRKYAELAIDSGADLIVGHHPHVVQALEQYKNTYIIYSLGNFVFDQYFSDETMQGGLLEVEINPESKQIETVVLKKVFLNKYFQVEKISD